MVAHDSRDRLRRVVYIDHPNDYAIDGLMGIWLGAVNVRARDIVSLSIVRGRGGPTTTPTAGTVTAVIRAEALPADVRVGQVLDVSMALFSHVYMCGGIDDGGHKEGRAGARITDVGPVQLLDPARRDKTVTVTGTTLYARLTRVQVGVPPMTFGDDLYRARLVTTAAIDKDPALRSFAATGYGYILDANNGGVGSPVELARVDVDNRTPDSVFADLIASTGATLVETRDGPLKWITREARRTAPLRIALDARDVLSPATTSQNGADLLNSIDVTYGPADDQGVVHAEDAVSINGTNPNAQYHYRDALGRFDGAITTVLARDVDALDVAADQVGRYAYPEWRLDEVSIDLLDMRERDRAQGGRAYLAEIGDLVRLDGLPSYSPVPSGGYYWIDGITETITARSWLLNWKLIPYGQLAAPPRYIDQPAGRRYIDVPADLTYSRATVWNPDLIQTGTYRATAANDTYAGAGTTRYADV